MRFSAKCVFFIHVGKEYIKARSIILKMQIIILEKRGAPEAPSLGNR